MLERHFPETVRELYCDNQVTVEFWIIKGPNIAIY